MILGAFEVLKIVEESKRGRLLDALEMLFGPATDRSNLTASVESDVITKILLPFMEAPVRIEVSASSQRTETENRFSPGQAPTRSRTIHSIFDQIPTCAFDDASGDR